MSSGEAEQFRIDDARPFEKEMEEKILKKRWKRR